MATGSCLPVIDATSLGDEASLRALDQACREWGFFHLVHHGVDPSVTDALHRAMSDFFALPDAAKQRVERSAENPWGFYGRELTKNVRDWKQIFDCGPEEDREHPTPWPTGLDDFRTAALAYERACEALAFRLLAALSCVLGVPADRLARDFRPRHTSFLRLNYYPPCPTPELPPDVRTPTHGHLGVNHHTDAGALTVLLQDDVPGLEVHHEGAWHLVEPRADSLVVNIGDIVQVWSNDRFPAALHRVRANRDRPRYSAPFFFNPAYDAYYAPIPSACGAEPARYRSIHWGEFRARRAAGDYQDQGVEVQIGHFRVDPV